jgi:hypothetical protein
MRAKSAVQSPRAQRPKSRTVGRGVFCAKCGKPTNGPRKFCKLCVDARLGVMIRREFCVRSLQAGWANLGDGSYMRRAHRGGV